MNIYEYYKELLLTRNKIPKEVKRYIFSFVIDDFKNIINDKKLETMISKYKNKNKIMIQRCPPIFHLTEVPYNYLLTNKNFKEKIEFLFDKEKIDVIFSHYCCNNKGICFCNPKAELNLTLFNPIVNNNY
jgi:hypothetical protein